MNRLRSPLAVLFMAVWAVGCTKSGPEIVPIAGTVTYKGQPVPNVRIIFQPTEGRNSWAIANANGQFALEYDSDHKGAKVSTHTVYVVDEGANDPTAALSGVARKQRS